MNERKKKLKLDMEHALEIYEEGGQESIRRAEEYVSGLYTELESEYGPVSIYRYFDIEPLARMGADFCEELYGREDIRTRRWQLFRYYDLAIKGKLYQDTDGLEEFADIEERHQRSKGFYDYAKALQLILLMKADMEAFLKNRDELLQTIPFNGKYLKLTYLRIFLMEDMRSVYPYLLEKDPLEAANVGRFILSSMVEENSVEITLLYSIESQMKMADQRWPQSNLSFYEVERAKAHLEEGEKRIRKLQDLISYYPEQEPELTADIAAVYLSYGKVRKVQTAVEEVMNRQLSRLELEPESDSLMLGRLMGLLPYLEGSDRAAGFLERLANLKYAEQSFLDGNCLDTMLMAADVLMEKGEYGKALFFYERCLNHFRNLLVMREETELLIMKRNEAARQMLNTKPYYLADMVKELTSFQKKAGGITYENLQMFGIINGLCGYLLRHIATLREYPLLTRSNIHTYEEIAAKGIYNVLSVSYAMAEKVQRMEKSPYMNFLAREMAAEFYRTFTLGMGIFSKEDMDFAVSSMENVKTVFYRAESGRYLKDISWEKEILPMIQGSLREGEVLLDYVKEYDPVKDEDCYAVFAISKEYIEVFPLGEVKEIRQLQEEITVSHRLIPTAAGIRRRQKEEKKIRKLYKGNVKQLRKLLLEEPAGFKEYLDLFDKVYISRTAGLEKVPFMLALNKANCYEVYSALDLRNRLERIEGETLCIANPERKGYPKLPGSGMEADSFGAVFGGEILTGKDASREQVLNAMRREWSLVHIGAHHDYMSLDEQVFELSGLSKLILSDGDLSGVDILKESLKMDVLTLGVCDSADLAGSTELYGLSRSFYEAGAKIVISSLVPIHDLGGAIFFTKFFQYLKKTGSPGMALHAGMKGLYSITRDECRAFILKHTDEPKERRHLAMTMPEGEKPFQDGYYWVNYILTGVEG